MSTITSEIKLRVRAEGDKVLADLGTKLNSLANQASLSSNNFKGLADELKKVQQTTIQSARNIKDYSASWRELASSVDISSKEFRQATAEAAGLDAQLAKIQGTSVRTAAAVQTAISGPITGGTAGAGIMRRPAEALEPYPRLGFETLDPKFHRERQRNAKDKQGNVLGQFNQPQFLDYGATDKALGNLQGSLQNVRDIEDRSRLERLELQEKFNNLEIQKQDKHAAKVLAKDRENADIGGRDFMQRLENREKQTSQRRQRFAGAAQTAGAIAASGIFGGPEGLVGSGIGAVVGGPMGAAAGGAIGAQVGMLRQAIGETATYASEITKLNIALKGITKTSQEYSDAQNAINSISKSLNVPIAEATSGFTRLSASVIGAGGNVNDAEIVFRGITTAMKATGRSSADVQGALLAMSQVFSKGKLSAEELSGQLGERLPGAVTAFAKATGRTLPQLQKDLENGVVGLNDVMKFAIALQVQYGDTAAKVASSSEESGARMTVALDEVKLAVGSAFQPIGSIFQDSVTEMVTDTKESLKILKEAISAISKVIKDLIGPDTLKAIKDFANANLDITKELKEGFKGLPLVIAASVDPLARTLALLLKIAEVAKLIKGEPQALGDGRYAAPGQQQKTPEAIKPPTNLPSPQDEAAEKARKAKEALELKNLLDVNETQKQIQRIEIVNLALLSQAKEKLNNILATETEETKKNNVEKIKGLRTQILELEYLNKANRLSANKEIDLTKLSLESNKQIAAAKKQGIIQEFNFEIAKLTLEKRSQQKEIETGITKEIDKQNAELENQKDQYNDILRTVQQSLDQPLAALGNKLEEEQLRLRFRRDPKKLEPQLENLKIRRDFQTIREQALSQLKPEDRKAFLDGLQVSEAAALRVAESIRQLKQQIEDLNATDFTQGIRNGVTTYLESIGTLSENVKDVTGSALQGLGDQLANFVSTGKISFTELANSIIKDMVRITTQQLIMKPILGALGGLFGGGGVANGTLAPTDMFKYANFAGGGIMTEMGAMPLKKYARGGVATGPQMALYGEGSQNEAYVPLPDGRRIPVAMQGGGGTTSVVVNVDAKGSNVEGDTPKGQQLGRALSQAVQAELLKQKRPGGLLN